LGQISALLGDIVATRLAVRGVAGVIVDGRIRDLPGCGELCSDGAFAVWSKGTSTVGTSLEAKPWSVDVPVQVGGNESGSGVGGTVVVRPGDFAVLDEAERGVVVVPRDKLVELSRILPGLKEADEGVLEDVRAGVGLKEAFRRHPGHYVNAP
jgi:regulator of RNase E activity RraA